MWIPVSKVREDRAKMPKVVWLRVLVGSGGWRWKGFFKSQNKGGDGSTPASAGGCGGRASAFYIYAWRLLPSVFEIK